MTPARGYAYQPVLLLTTVPERTVDLQTHSIHSDGTFTPQEIAEHADEKGLAAVALTDHDTVAGIPSFLQAGRSTAVETVPGIELSCRVARQSVDVLGYLIDHEHEPLHEALKELRQHRRERMPKMLDRLEDEGIHLTLEDVEHHATGDVLGRPHLAQAILEHGHVDTLDEAFERYIGDRGPAYVPKRRLAPDEAIRLIHDAGGLAVMAHPCYVHPAHFPTLLETLVQAGLDGIEVYYSDHDAQHVAFFTQQARKHDLVMTGGSDFHGENKPKIQLGTGYGDLKVPYRALEALKERHANA